MDQGSQPSRRTRPARGLVLKSAALALALSTGVAGVWTLDGPSAPAFAQSMQVGNQPITPSTFSTLAEQVSPSVVAVRVTGGRERNFDLDEMFPRDNPFRDFFDRYFEDRGQPSPFDRFERRGERDDEGPRMRPRLSQGSGFIISPDGHIVTNNHVIEGAESITVVVNGSEEEYEAEVLGRDPRTDLAVLKIDAGKALPHVEFAEGEAKVGDWVMAVGNPFGLGGTVTTGIVSARGRQIGSGPYDDYLQIDAAVNRGNSGGPTFSLNGSVIGVNTAIYSPNGGSVGIGFAIPASVARDVVDQLIEHGSITRGWIGVSIQNVTPDIAESVGLDEPSGAIIAEIFPDGPASKSDLQVGDVVLEVNGQTIETTRDLARTIADIAPGKTAELVVQRNRSEQTVELTTGTMPQDPERVARGEPQEQTPDNSAEERLADLGLRVEPASEVEGSDDARGVVVTDVAPDSEASEKGIRRGDRIMRVAGAEVNTPTELSEALASARDDGLDSVLVLLRSDNGQRFVTLDLTRA